MNAYIHIINLQGIDNVTEDANHIIYDCTGATLRRRLNDKGLDYLPPDIYP